MLGMRILRPAASRTAQRPAARPAGLAGERQAARPGSPGSRRNQLPLPLPAGMRTQQPPQPGPHADQRLAVHEPLKVLSLRLCKEQRVQDEALVILTHVVHAPTRPGHMQRQLHPARGRPFQVLQRRWHTTRIITPARRQGTILHADNYPRSARHGHQARRAVTRRISWPIARAEPGELSFGPPLRGRQMAGHPAPAAQLVLAYRVQIGRSSSYVPLQPKSIMQTITTHFSSALMRPSGRPPGLRRRPSRRGPRRSHGWRGRIQLRHLADPASRGSWHACRCGTSGVESGSGRSFQPALRA